LAVAYGRALLAAMVRMPLEAGRSLPPAIVPSLL
jgi:hypothetical protein